MKPVVVIIEWVIHHKVIMVPEHVVAGKARISIAKAHIEWGDTIGAVPSVSPVWIEIVSMEPAYP